MGIMGLAQGHLSGSNEGGVVHSPYLDFDDQSGDLQAPFSKL